MKHEERSLNNEPKVLDEPVVLPSPKPEEKPEEKKVEYLPRAMEREVLPEREEEKKPFGVSQFVKLIVFGLLFVITAYFLGSSLRFIYDQPFFFVAWAGSEWLTAAMAGVSLLIFMVVAGIAMVAYERSFLAFIPAWVVTSLGFFVGLGEYGTVGAAAGCGFALGLMLFFVVVKGDLKDSFNFSVRQAFSSMGIFLTIFFVAVAGGYYIKVEQILSSAELLPAEIMDPVISLEKRVMASQLGVQENEVENKLKELEESGQKVSFFGLFDLDAKIQTQGLYDWMSEKVSEVVLRAVPYVAGGLAFVLFCLLSFTTPLISILSRSVIFVVMEGLVAIGVFTRKKVLREAEILEI